MAVLLGLGGCAGAKAPGVPPPSPRTAVVASAASPTSTAASSAAASDGPRISIHLSPASGPPGTVVTIAGSVPAGDLLPRLTPSHATACWVSCRTGWTQGALPIRWSAASPGAFTLQMQVPPVPWVSAAGVKPLAPGTYRIGVACVLPRGDCAARSMEATASFRLTGPVPATCTAGQPCGRLVLSPDGGPPGTRVLISGWAPISPAFGFALRAGFDLGVAQLGARSQGLGIGQVQQRPNGDLYGSFVLPTFVQGIGELTPGPATLAAFSSFSATDHVTVAEASFRVETAPAWASLGTLHPELVQQAVPGSSASAGERQARCLPGGNIDLSTNGGSTWTAVPTAGVTAALKGTPYSTTWGGATGATPPTCATVALQPGGGAIFAAFGGVDNGSAPPVYWFPLVTRDGGQTWHLLPSPTGYKPSAFSRFEIQGGALLALFWDGPKAAFGLEQTVDGGLTWTGGYLACPATGPCVAWGPAPDHTWPGVCNAQAVLRSDDHGVTWTVSDSVCYTGTGPQGPYELATLPDGRVLLLGGANYPVRVSGDSGRTWTAVSVPRLPGQSATTWYPAVRLVGDGTLGAKWTGGVWWALPPGAAEWCRTSRPAGHALSPDTLLRCATGVAGTA